MKKRFILPLLLSAIISTSALSCQPSTSITPKKSIVVTHAVLGSLVKDLVGEQASVIVPVPNGLDPHEWEPSARDIEAFNKADLVIENGLGLESGLEKTLSAARSQGVRFFTASDYIKVRYVGLGEGIPGGGPEQAVGAPDPHIWTDPLAMKSFIAALAPVLKKELGLDVEDQATDLEKRLDSLNNEVAGIMASVPLENRKLVTGHDSMGYFAQRYGFKLVGVIIPSLSTQAGVTAADLAALKKAIRENRVKAIFTELGTSPAVVKAISEDTGVRVVELKAAILSGDGSYFTFMKDLANDVANVLK